MIVTICCQCKKLKSCSFRSCEECVECKIPDGLEVNISHGFCEDCYEQELLKIKEYAGSR